MHVGVEEAVAQRVPQEILYHLAAEIRQVDLRGLEFGAIVQRDAVDPLHRQHMMAGAIPIHRRHAEIMILAGVLRHLRERGRFQPQIHFHRHRARQRIDDLDRTQPPRFGRNRFDLSRREHEIAEIMTEAAANVGSQHLHRDRLADAVFLDFGAMHLRDGCGGDRFAEARKHLCHRPLEGVGDHGFGLRLRKRRQTILQILKIARHRDANHVGTGGEKLAELDVSWAKPSQCAGQPSARDRAAPLDQPRHADRELRLRRHGGWIGEAENAFAREHVTCARQSQGMSDGRDHKRQPEWSATMPPDMTSYLTREKPAAWIMSAKALGFGNCRIDSTR